MKPLEFRATFKCACGKGIGLHLGQGPVSQQWFIQIVHKNEYIARVYIEDASAEESAKQLIEETNQAFVNTTFWSDCRWAAA